MNVFVLDEDPKHAARDMCNKHVVKMLVESAQILSTAFRQKMEELTGVKDKHEHYARLYRSTHANHPAVKWTKESVHNTDWLWQHASELYCQYTLRYGKHHKTGLVLEEFNELRWMMWNGLGDWRLHSPFAQCMPFQHRIVGDAVTAYRKYYVNEKASFAKWAPRARAPLWWPNPDA